MCNRNPTLGEVNFTLSKVCCRSPRLSVALWYIEIALGLIRVYEMKSKADSSLPSRVNLALRYFCCISRQCTGVGWNIGLECHFKFISAAKVARNQTRNQAGNCLIALHINVEISHSLPRGRFKANFKAR
jgi:hypothetical protein